MPTYKMTESAAQGIMMKYLLDEKHHVLAVPNSRVIYSWEADLLSITKSLLVHEFEVKLTLADYQRDFDKKWKHWYLRGDSTHGPNYFWYVPYGMLIDPPEYAGWINITHDAHRQLFAVDVQKEAPRLHKQKISEKKQADIGRLLAYRLKNMYQVAYVNELLDAISQGELDVK